MWRRKYKAVTKALTDEGWSVTRQHGSHEVWAHPDHENRIVVAGKDSDTIPMGRWVAFVVLAVWSI